MKRLFGLLFLMAGLVISSKAFAISEEMTRLHTLLNNHYLNKYLITKGYSSVNLNIHFGSSGALGDISLPKILFADYQYTSDNRLEITLYLQRNPTVHHAINKVDGKVKAAQEFCRLILLLCTDFLGNNHEPIKLIVKNPKILEAEGNTIFTWENGKIEYFPPYFDENL